MSWGPCFAASGVPVISWETHTQFMRAGAGPHGPHPLTLITLVICIQIRMPNKLKTPFWINILGDLHHQF